jgi:transketolase
VLGKPPGIDMTTGSLGHGLAVGTGMALAGRMMGLEYHVFVVMGDGELNEGIVWEAVQVAAHHGVGRLIAFVDHNGYQSGGLVGDVSGMGDIAARFAAFGWHTQEIDGHDTAEILSAIEAAKRDPRPSVIVARTVKGKGVPFMEGDNSWHKRVPTKEELAAAIRCLEAAHG